MSGDKMKNIKKYIIVLLFIMVWIIIFALAVRSGNKQEEKNTTQYVLIDPFNYWKYTNQKWENIDSINDFDKVTEEINWKKYDIYVNNQYFNTLDYVLKNGQEYYFDDDTHSYEVPQEKLLLNEGSYFNIKEFYLDNFLNNDLNIVNEFLNKYNHSSNNLTVQQKYSIEDNKSIYIISNYPDNYPEDDSGLFYLVFYRQDNKNYLLVDMGYAENVSNYKLAWVLNTESKLDNFILSYTCEEATCYDMYEYQKGKYLKVIGT